MNRSRQTILAAAVRRSRLGLRRHAGSWLLATALAAGCASTPPMDTVPTAQPAVLAPDPPAPVRIMEIPEPLPLPGQLRPVAPDDRPADAALPTERVERANAAARIEPARDGFINAMQVYPFTDGALYQVYTAVGHITDIALAPGETLAGPGPVAAGDTVRWIIGDTQSGSGEDRRVHILVKPTRPDLVTNLIINTDRRTYHLELRSTAATYMASVSWRYPQDALIALRQQTTQTAAAAPIAGDLDLTALRFDYAIEGDNPPWRPVRAFDDGRQVFIAFPPDIARHDMPPLFLVGADGEGAELVNYRIHGRYMIVDRLFAAAELRLGAEDPERVRIRRLDRDRRGAFAWLRRTPRDRRRRPHD